MFFIMIPILLRSDILPGSGNTTVLLFRTCCLHQTFSSNSFTSSMFSTTLPCKSSGMLPPRISRQLIKQLCLVFEPIPGYTPHRPHTFSSNLLNFFPFSCELHQFFRTVYDNSGACGFLVLLLTGTPRIRPPCKPLRSACLRH